MASNSVIVRVPAKVNLQLSVGPLREDGYHELATVFHAVSLCDEVKATYAELGAGITLTISGEGADHLPVDESNLAYRAAMLLAAHAGIEADVTMHLNKGIPVAGGMVSLAPYLQTTEGGLAPNAGG
jgi:4-diphosphocytidyl-2-C-methyl-D-erythritol kinase